MNRHRTPRALMGRGGLALALACPALAVPQDQDPVAHVRFELLDALPGSEDLESGAFEVSGNGRIVLGYSSSTRSRAAREASRWRSSRVIDGFGTLPTNNVWGEARGISGNGPVIVGATSEGDRLRAFAWAEGFGLFPLTEPNGAVESAALAVSDDGSTIVGWTEFHEPAPFDSVEVRHEATIWQGGAPTTLGFFAGGYTSEAADVSADGRFVVGWSDVDGNDGAHEAWIWQATTGLVSLGDLPGGLQRSKAIRVADDGDVVTGWGIRNTNPYGFRTFRWTPAGGLADLGVLAGDYNSQPTDMTPDGSVIVGWSGVGGGFARRPMICDQAHGMRDLMAVMEARGVDLTGWRDHQGWSFMEATGVSDDGRTIVGRGRFENHVRGWVLFLP